MARAPAKNSLRAAEGVAIRLDYRGPAAVAGLGLLIFTGTRSGPDQ